MMLVHMKSGENHLTLELEYPSIGEFIKVDFGRGSAIKKVHEDNRGKKYFVWDNNRMYLEYLKDYTMKGIQEKVDKKEHISRYELLLAIINDGINQVRFLAPLPTLRLATPFGFGLYSNDDPLEVTCKINEDRYKVKEGYKITLAPEDGDIRFASRDYYDSDLLGLIRSGIIKIVS